MSPERPAFILDPDSRAGIVYRPLPGLRRIVADNPGPFTHSGTGSYIVGAGEVALIDPGPELVNHVEALLQAIEGERLSHILITHPHQDHSPAARMLQALTGAAIAGPAPLPPLAHPNFGHESVDRAYAPDIVLGDGGVIVGPGWTLSALATPGHVANHLCYHWREADILFSGDHVMGWASSVILPPDGDMGDYLQSLEKVRAGGFASLWPTHGLPIFEPQPFITGLIEHRRHREAEILAAIDAGCHRLDAIVERVYRDLPKTLIPAAGQSVRAHLIDLERKRASQLLKLEPWRAI